MSDYKTLRRKLRLRAGSFTDVSESLLPLFCGSGARGDARWRLPFGLDPAALPPLPAKSEEHSHGGSRDA